MLCPDLDQSQSIEPDTAEIPLAVGVAVNSVEPAGTATAVCWLQGEVDIATGSDDPELATLVGAR